MVGHTLCSNALFRIVFDESLSEDVLVLFVESYQTFREQWSRLVGRPRKNKQQEGPNHHGEDSLYDKNPLPSCQTLRTVEMQETRRQYRTQCIAPKHPEEKDRNPRAKFSLPIPRRQSVNRAWNIARLGQAKQTPHHEEASAIPDEHLQCSDKSEDKNLCRYPFPRAESLQDQVVWDFQNYCS